MFDPYDNCPDAPNPSQANADFDAMGDACDPSTTLSDSDHDGAPDAGDHCASVANPGQEDVDHDGIGDVCDEVRELDADGDGVVDAKDDCPKVANPTQLDSDSAGIGDAGNPTPNGTPAFWALKAKIGRCLYDRRRRHRVDRACDPTQRNQQWECSTLAAGRARSATTEHAVPDGRQLDRDARNGTV